MAVYQHSRHTWYELTSLRLASKDETAHLVKPPSLPVPLFDTVQRRLACQVEHEQDGHCVVGDEREHGDEFSLAA